jgi:hypothetical protein
MKRIIFLLLSIVLCWLAACRKDVVDVRNFGKVVIDSITPGAGPSDMYVRIYGKNFSYKTADAKVYINNLEAPVIQTSPDTMLIYIPKGAVTGRLQFMFNRKNPTNDEFNYSGQMDSVAEGPEVIINETLLPSLLVEQIVPANGKAGDTITIRGYNFSAGNCKIFFGAAEGAITQVTATAIKVRVPKTTPGTVLLSILQGTQIVNAGNFVVEETPVGVKEIYWTGNGIPANISKAIIDEFGNAVIQELYGAADNIGNVTGLKADVANGFVYWIDNNAIYRGSTDGTAPVALIYTDAGPLIADMDIDKSGRLYISCWSSVLTGYHAIKRLNADGTGKVEELYQLLGEPYAGGLKVDVANGKLYWTEYMSLSVFEGSIDGQLARPAKLLFDASDGLASPANIAIHPADGHIYIMDNGNNIIYKGALDGSGSLQALPVLNTDIVGAGDVEIDPVNRYLYWHLFEYVNGAVMRCKTDGTGVQRVVNNIKSGSFLDLVL